MRKLLLFLSFSCLATSPLSAEFSWSSLYQLVHQYKYPLIGATATLVGAGTLTTVYGFQNSKNAIKTAFRAISGLEVPHIFVLGGLGIGGLYLANKYLPSLLGLSTSIGNGVKENATSLGNIIWGNITLKSTLGLIGAVVLIAGGYKISTMLWNAYTQPLALDEFEVTEGVETKLHPLNNSYCLCVTTENIIQKCVQISKNEFGKPILKLVTDDLQNEIVNKKLIGNNQDNAFLVQDTKSNGISFHQVKFENNKISISKGLTVIHPETAENKRFAISPDGNQVAIVYTLLEPIDKNNKEKGSNHYLYINLHVLNNKKFIDYKGKFKVDNINLANQNHNIYFDKQNVIFVDKDNKITASFKKENPNNRNIVSKNEIEPNESILPLSNRTVIILPKTKLQQITPGNQRIIAAALDTTNNLLLHFWTYSTTDQTIRFKDLKKTGEEWIIKGEDEYWMIYPKFSPERTVLSHALELLYLNSTGEIEKITPKQKMKLGFKNFKEKITSSQNIQKLQITGNNFIINNRFVTPLPDKFTQP
ncbi:MAG: hypothetical protein JW725_01960 [Candidatus Babeliaceae bacterium]|nr:hypothetical protein [Candidatus Babeliaceae bacterium]